MLAAGAAQPDYAAMERMLRRTKDALTTDRRWAGDLLTRALDALLPQIARQSFSVNNLSAALNCKNHFAKRVCLVKID